MATEFSALSEKKGSYSPKADATFLPSAHHLQLLHLQEQQQQSNGKRWSFLDKDPMGKKPSSSSSRANSISEREAALFTARRSLEDGGLITSNPAASISSGGGVRRHSEPSAEFMMDTTRSASSSRRGSFRTANSGGSTSGRLQQSHRAKGSESSLSLSSNTSSSAFPPSLDLGHGLTHSPPMETPHFSLYSPSLKPLTPTIISNDCPIHSSPSPNPNATPLPDGVCTCETQGGSRWPRAQNSLDQSPSTSTHSHNAPSVSENQPSTPGGASGNMNANNPAALFDVQKRRRAQAFDQFTSYTAAMPFHRPAPSRQTSANSSGGSGAGSAEGVEISMTTGRILSGPASASVFTSNELSRHVQQQSLSLSGTPVNPLGGGLMRPLHTTNSTPDFHSSSAFDMKSWRQQRKEEVEEDTDFGTVLTPVADPEVGKSGWRVSGLFSGLQRTQSQTSHLRRRSDQFDPHLHPNMRQEIPQSKKSSWRKIFYLRALFPSQPNDRSSPSPSRRGEGPIRAEVSQTTVYSIQSAAAAVQQQQQQPPPSAFSTSGFAYATPPAARLSTSSELVYPQSYSHYR